MATSGTLIPALQKLLSVRAVVGVRNSGHTVAKMLNPCRSARCLRLVNFTHPEFGALMTACGGGGSSSESSVTASTSTTTTTTTTTIVDEVPVSTVVGPEGKPLEVQIRTRDMHRTAEYGIAAHWRYKEEGGSNFKGQKYDEKIAWLRQLLTWKDEVADSSDWVSHYKQAALDDTVMGRAD